MRDTWYAHVGSSGSLRRENSRGHFQRERDSIWPRIKGGLKSFWKPRSTTAQTATLLPSQPFSTGISRPEPSAAHCAAVTLLAPMGGKLLGVVAGLGFRGADGQNALLRQARLRPFPRGAEMSFRLFHGTQGRLLGRRRQAELLQRQHLAAEPLLENRLIRRKTLGLGTHRPGVELLGRIPAAGQGAPTADSPGAGGDASSRAIGPLGYRPHGRLRRRRRLIGSRSARCPLSPLRFPRPHWPARSAAIRCGPSRSRAAAIASASGWGSGYFARQRLLPHCTMPASSWASTLACSRLSTSRRTAAIWYSGRHLSASGQSAISFSFQTARIR